jgi:hypothetical protein
MTPAQLSFFGFDINEKFFSTQGGVFHMVLSVAYIMGAENIGKSDQKNPIWMVLISGIADFLMGLVLLITFLNYKKKIHAQKE